MLLRIIDQGDDAIEVVFQSPLLNKSFPIEFYDSPVYSNFQQSLAWYFSEFPLSLDKTAQAEKSQSVVQRLIAFGQAMGEKLKGEDFELVAITEHIEKIGYQQLQVRFESDNIDFFGELWEATVLPEAKYMLSCAGRSFVRTFTTEQLEDLRFDLEVTAPVNPEMAAMLQQSQGQVAEQDKVFKPLKVCKWLSRGVDDVIDGKRISSNSFNISFNAHSAGAVTVFDIVNPADSKALHLALDCHLLHYDGSIVIDDGAAYFQLTGGAEHQLISVSEVAKSMVEHQVPCLLLQPSAIIGDVTPQQAVAIVAKAAQIQGVGNIVGLNQLSPCWVADLCFEQLYRAITLGLTVSQAVVEARKVLQANVQIDLVEVEPSAFHPWSLLQHYGNQKLQYFVDGHQLADETAPAQQAFYQRLLGFKSAMLPPLLHSTSDGQAVALYHQLGQHQVVNVLGERGCGKTQLAHMVALYLAQNELVDFCFYFDFGSDQFKPQHLQQMIAPVLELDVSASDEVNSVLAQKRCCFVFDNCEQMSAEVADFIAEHWQPQQHQMIVIGQSQLSCGATMEVQPLSFADQQILVANRLRQLGIKKTPQQQWYQTLAQVNGNPWLVEQITPLLSNNKSETLKPLFSALQDNDDKVEGFYHYQWQQLDSVSQRFLVLCSTVSGLLLEMVMIAFDAAHAQQQESSSSRQLTSYLADGKSAGKVKMAELISQWQQQGFIAQFPHGRMIDSRCLAFIAKQHEPCFGPLLTEEGAKQDDIDLCLSQLLCQGISTLGQHVLKEPNPNISNNLILNRREWVKHFERLWFNQDYRGFMAVKQVFEQILAQAQIAKEINEWLFDLLKRTEPVALGSDSDVSMQQQLAWLALGVSALANPELKVYQHPHFVTMAEYAQAWLVKTCSDQPDSIAEADLPLMQQCVSYLEPYYQQQQQWQQAIDVSSIALGIYQKHQAWQRVIATSRNLAMSYHQLGEKDKALASEQVIISEVPYDGAPEGFKHQQLMDILFARLGRKDTANAQSLLDEIKTAENMGPMQAMLDGVQCDIHYQNGDYRSAAPYFCKTWEQIQGDRDRLAQLHPRLVELGEKIGQQEFDQIFAENTGEGCLHPGDFSPNS